MKVKVEKRYPTIEKYRAKLKIKKYIISTLSVDLMLIMVGYLCGKALNEIYK